MKLMICRFCFVFVDHSNNKGVTGFIYLLLFFATFALPFSLFRKQSNGRCSCKFVIVFIPLIFLHKISDNYDCFKESLFSEKVSFFFFFYREAFTLKV